MDALDLAGYNYIDRLYGTNIYVPERARFPHRLCLGTETGSAVHYWLGVRDHDYVIGEFIWTGIDYLGEAGRFPSRGNGSGFIDIAGGKKPGFYQRAAYWRDDPVLQILVFNAQNPDNFRRGRPSLSTWNWPADSQLTVRAVANCEEVELFLNDRSLGRHAISRDVYASDWSVAYAPGVLSAVGHDTGRQVAAQKLVTTGTPARLQVTQVLSPISSDIAFYEITVVDEAGLTVQDATPAVTVRVEGAGRLIGLDTGDLGYDGLFKTDTRKAYQGRLLATVQRTTPTGQVRLTAATPGMPTAEKAGNE
jgi:hypothetical protein